VAKPRTSTDPPVRDPVHKPTHLVEKRPVAKEEIRIRKDVVEDAELVEEELRREEVEVDDATERRNR
jgi:stress response protein YsnF